MLTENRLSLKKSNFAPYYKMETIKNLMKFGFYSGATKIVYNLHTSLGRYMNCMLDFVKRFLPVMVNNCLHKVGLVKYCLLPVMLYTSYHLIHTIYD
jgi:hypothetical protein